MHKEARAQTEREDDVITDTQSRAQGRYALEELVQEPPEDLLRMDLVQAMLSAAFELTAGVVLAVHPDAVVEFVEFEGYVPGQGPRDVRGRG